MFEFRWAHGVHAELRVEHVRVDALGEQPREQRARRGGGDGVARDRRRWQLALVADEDHLLRAAAQRHERRRLRRLRRLVGQHR